MMRIKESIKAANEIRSKKEPRLTARDLALLIFKDSKAAERSKISMLSQLERGKLVDIEKARIVMEYTGVSLDFLLGFTDEPFK